MNKDEQEIKELIRAFAAQDRRALAKAITLIESESISDKKKAQQLLKAIRKPEQKTLRLAISGPPGVGKSTFINAFGQELLKQHCKIAILPIDPSSLLSGGSILADKTRMNMLINNADVFIRPSPSRGVLGGISIALSDVILLVESFGFDVIIIETVGVGQSESHAYSLSDFFLMLMQPGSGDALSAMKKGVVERVDYLVVNKADGLQKELALQTFNMLKGAFALGIPEIFLVSSYENVGIDQLVNKLLDVFQQKISAGIINEERKERFGEFFHFAFSRAIAAKIFQVPWVKERCTRIMEEASLEKKSLLILLDELADEIVERCR